MVVSLSLLVLTLARGRKLLIPPADIRGIPAPPSLMISSPSAFFRMHSETFGEDFTPIFQPRGRVKLDFIPFSAKLITLQVPEFQHYSSFAGRQSNQAGRYVYVYPLCLPAGRKVDISARWLLCLPAKLRILEKKLLRIFLL